MRVLILHQFNIVLSLSKQSETDATPPGTKEGLLSLILPLGVYA
jgi:hypothetical protein